MRLACRGKRLLPFLAVVFLFSHCSDVSEIKERYLAERMYYRANKQYQNIQVTPRGASPLLYRQARESFRMIMVKYPISCLQGDDRFSGKVREELIELVGNSQLMIADLFFQEGQIDSAIVEYQSIVANYAPENALRSRAQYFTAAGYQMLGRWDEAVAAYETLLREYTPFIDSPEQPNVNMLQVPSFIAQVYQAQGQKDEADRYFERAREYLSGVTEKWPSSAVALFAQEQIAGTYVIQQRWQQAIAALEPLESAHQDTTDPSEISFTIANLYWEKLRDPSRAMLLYTRLLEAYPHSQKLSRAYLAIGKIHLERGELLEARQTLSKVIADFPGDAAAGANAQYSIGLTYEIEGEWDKALNEFHWIVENYPMTPEALQVPIHILDHYLQFSEKELAAVAYRQALEEYADFINKNSDSPMASYGQWYIAQVHMRMEKWTEAITALEVLVTQFPQSTQAPYAMLAIGEMYQVRLEQSEEALKVYQQLIDTAPSSVPAQIAAQRVEILEETKE